MQTDGNLSCRTCRANFNASRSTIAGSAGGLIALLVAARAPSRVRSLALMCTFASGAVPTRPSPRLMWLGIRTRVGTRRMRRRAFLEMVMPSAYLSVCDVDELASRLQFIFSHDLADTPPVVMQQFAATRRCDASGFLGAMGGIPTLVMSAEHDPIAPPRYGRELAAGIPGARYVEIAGASHGATIQRASDVNALLLEHLRAAS